MNAAATPPAPPAVTVADDSGGMLRRIATNISALTGANLANRAVGLAASILLARYLGVIEQGTYALVLNFTGIFVGFSDLGIGMLVIRDMNTRPGRAADLVGGYFSTLAWANLGLYLLSLAVAAGLGYDARVFTAIAIGGIGTALGGLSAAFYVTLTGHERMKQVALLETAVTALVIAGYAVVMLSGGGLIALACIMTAAGAARLSLFAVPALRMLPGLRLWSGVARVGRTLREGLPFTLHVGLLFIVTRIDMPSLELLSDPYSLGLYSVAARLAVPFTLFPMMAAIAIFPIVSRLAANDAPAAHALVRRIMRLLGIGGAAIATGATLAAGPVITLLFGAPYAPAASVLRVLAWFIPVQFFYYLVTDLLVASHRVWGVVRISTAVLAADVALNVILIPRWGASGAAAAIVIAETLRGALLLVYARRAIGFSLRRPSGAAPPSDTSRPEERWET